MAAQCQRQLINHTANYFVMLQMPTLSSRLHKHNFAPPGHVTGTSGHRDCHWNLVNLNLCM